MSSQGLLQGRASEGHRGERDTCAETAMEPLSLQTDGRIRLF